MQAVSAGGSGQGVQPDGGGKVTLTRQTSGTICRFYLPKPYNKEAWREEVQSGGWVKEIPSIIILFMFYFFVVDCSAGKNWPAGERKRICL